ncbi:hypothetical protein [Curvivirga aplysinae]|uniref:hypothetical protein n=1 Tax=Curvivirga aplysinae TaxID=2529852 RepID=UPI0012BBA449|nr:hypothetical protein [Curvivirga aplysinae]MTI11172.1 hypothetical protein [Curvivirga aplysinae]
MSTNTKQLEDKLQRLSIALDRLSKDKKEARQTLISDIKKVQQDIIKAKSKPVPKSKPTNLGTIIIASVFIAVVIGFISFFSTGGRL